MGPEGVSAVGEGTTVVVVVVVVVLVEAPVLEL
jgi:hypothetical protein